MHATSSSLPTNDEGLSQTQNDGALGLALACSVAQTRCVLASGAHRLRFAFMLGSHGDAIDKRSVAQTRKLEGCQAGVAQSVDTWELELLAEGSQLI